MSFIAPIGQMLGAGIQAYGQYEQGQAEKKMYDYQAQATMQQSEFEKSKISDEEAILSSTQQAAYAKAGVKLSGSPLDVMLDSATNYEYDKLITDYNAKQKAAVSTYYGKQAEAKGKFNAGMSILGGVIKVAQSLPMPGASFGGE